MSLKNSAVINLGYPIYDVRFVNGGTIIAVGGGGEGNNGIPNKITAVKCSFKMKEPTRRLQKFREITLPANEDSPHCMDIERVGEDVTDYSVFIGCNQSSQLIKTMNINNYLRKYVYNSDEHLRFIDAVQLEEEVTGDGVDYPKIIRLAPNNLVGCVMTSSYPSVINIFNPDSLDLSFKFQPAKDVQIKDFHLSPKDGKTLCYITSSSIATVSTVTGNLIDSTDQSADVTKELQHLNLSKVRFVDDTHVLISANHRVKKEAYLLLYSIQDKKIIRRKIASKKFSSIVAIDLCKARDLVAIVGNDLSVSLIRLSDFHVIKVFRKLHPFAITSVAFSPNGTKLATGSAAHSLHVLKLPANYAQSKSTLGTLFQYTLTILFVVGLGILLQTGKENGQLEVLYDYSKQYGEIGLTLAQEYGNKGYKYISDLIKGENLDGLESDEYFSVDHWDEDTHSEDSREQSSTTYATESSFTSTVTTTSTTTPAQSKTISKKKKATPKYSDSSKVKNQSDRSSKVTNTQSSSTSSEIYSHTSNSSETLHDGKEKSASSPSPSVTDTSATSSHETVEVREENDEVNVEHPQQEEEFVEIPVAEQSYDSMEADAEVNSGTEVDVEGGEEEEEEEEEEVEEAEDDDDEEEEQREGEEVEDDVEEGEEEHEEGEEAEEGIEGEDGDDEGDEEGDEEGDDQEETEEVEEAEDPVEKDQAEEIDNVDDEEVPEEIEGAENEEVLDKIEDPVEEKEENDVVDTEAISDESKEEDVETKDEEGDANLSETLVELGSEPENLEPETSKLDINVVSTEEVKASDSESIASSQDTYQENDEQVLHDKGDTEGDHIETENKPNIVEETHEQKTKENESDDTQKDKVAENVSDHHKEMVVSTEPVESSTESYSSDEVYHYTHTLDLDEYPESQEVSLSGTTGSDSSVTEESSFLETIDLGTSIETVVSLGTVSEQVEETPASTSKLTSTTDSIKVSEESSSTSKPQSNTSPASSKPTTKSKKKKISSKKKKARSKTSKPKSTTKPIVHDEL